MRQYRLLIPCILALYATEGAAQRALPSSYASGSQVNAIRTWQVKAPITNPALVSAADLREVKMTTVYYDGLGREIQTVIKKGSLPTGDTARDLVAGKVYDPEGRLSIDYLPFSANNTGSNPSISDGGFKRNPFAQQTAYYNGRLAGQTGETNVGPSSLTWAYNETIFDGSPMDRTTKVLPAGASWVGSNRGQTTNYWVNTNNDRVRQWIVTDVPGNWGTYASPGIYPAGTLFKNVVTDEEGRQEVTFTDKEGRIILVKRQGTAPTDDGTGADSIVAPQSWLSTYYLYDDVGNLRLIIQPKFCEYLRPHWFLDSTRISNLCFRYEYNGRRQLIRSKKPGMEEVRYVYDQRGRLVLVQDGNCRNQSINKWLYTTYDSLNRVTSTGIWTSNTTWATMLTEGETSNNYPTLSPGTFEELTVKRYDQYQNLPSGFTAQLDATSLNASTIVTSYGTSPEYAEQLLQASSVDGRLAWEGEKILGTTQWLYKVYYYDEKGRLIQQRAMNASGAISNLTTQYNFTGQVIRTVRIHQQGGTNPSNITICTKITYDDLGREIYYGQKTNPADPYKTQATFTYDHLGKLKTKTYGTHPVSGQPLESQDFAYNVRGWLLGINQPFALDSTDDSRWFGEQLSYDNDGPLVHGVANAMPQKRYDGGIGRVLWKTTGDQKIRKYDLAYDPFNQLTSAVFSQFRGSEFVLDEINFSMGGAYDANGNLTTLTHFGWTGGGIRIIDGLNYLYDGDNKLLSVADGYNDYNSALGDFHYSKSLVGGVKWGNYIDYTYDPNGNVTKDRNKDIDTILYNHLNLPTQVRVRGKGIVYYNYTANGVRLEKIVVDSTQNPVLTTTTRYIDQVVYHSSQHSSAQPQDYVDKMQYFLSAEGRTRSIGGGVFKDDYLIKDHLGSVRMVLTDELGIDNYPTLSFEGSAGSAQVTDQDNYWENKTGAPINVTAVRTARPGNFGDTTANGQQVMSITRAGGAVAAAKLLKVQSKDYVHVKVDVYYTAANANNGAANGLSTLLANLGSALTSSGHFADFLKPAASDLVSGLSGNTALASLLNTPANTSSGYVAPKAYLNVIFFDQQMKVDIAASRVFPIPYSPNAKAVIDKRLANAIQARKNGWVYVYFSNESNELVYFDNFTLSHEHSPLLEEEHYYPFGLPMAGLSSKSVGKLPIKYAFNGKELQSQEFGPGTGLQWHDFGARMYDHQTGRWLSPDPHAARYDWISPYAFAFNNPMQVSDPTGRDGVVTGSGKSEKDPYVIHANYYMYGMTDEQAAAFAKAVEAYNNAGVMQIAADGQTVFVKFEIGYGRFETKAEAKEAAGNDVVKQGTAQYSFGNTVTVGSVPGEQNRDAYGRANNYEITLDENKMQAAVSQFKGVTIEQLRTGTAIHEIGHNLGGVHGDPGSIMDNADINSIPDNRGIGLEPSFRAHASSVDPGGVRAIAGRMHTLRRSIESKYISAKERKKLTEFTRTGNIQIVTEAEFKDR